MVSDIGHCSQTVAIVVCLSYTCSFAVVFSSTFFVSAMHVHCTDKILGDWHVNRLDAPNNIVLLTYNPPILLAHRCPLRYWY
jgi:hypothetical protein